MITLWFIIKLWNLEKIITLEGYLSKDSVSMFSMSLAENKLLTCNAVHGEHLQNACQSLAMTAVCRTCHCAGFCLCPKDYMTFLHKLSSSLFRSLHATAVFFFFLIPCCHFSAISNVSQCFNFANNGVLWCFLCLTCLWSHCFNSSGSMWFGFLSFTLSSD